MSWSFHLHTTMFENIRCLANAGNHFCVCQYHRKLEFQFCFHSLGYYYDLSVDFNIFHMLIKNCFSFLLLGIVFSFVSIFSHVSYFLLICKSSLYHVWQFVVFIVNVPPSGCHLSLSSSFIVFF